MIKICPLISLFILLSFTSKSQNNVGIGTTSPATKLEVVGTITTQGIILPAGAVNGHVLTSNASGVASWQSASAGATAQYVQMGSQPATIGAGQPFTFSTVVLSSPEIIAMTDIFNPPFWSNGTVFTLINTGRYEINYQTSYYEDGAIVLYLGPTITTMLPLDYSSVGKPSFSSVTGSVIIETTTPNSFLSVNAAPGNPSAISVPPNSGGANQTATTISIKKIN